MKLNYKREGENVSDGEPDVNNGPETARKE